MERKTAVVTGSSRGIGREIALTLARENYNVVINYVSNEDKAKDVLNALNEFGGEHTVIKADVSDYNECKELADKVIEKYGCIDVLVNNAGITRDGLLLRMKEQAFDDVISANLKSVFNMISVISPYMVKKRYGRIINISSVAGVYGNKGQINYSASKAGIIGITKTASKELGARNITVNAVAPGFIETEMTEVLSDKIKEAVIGNTSLGRMGKCEDIAETVAFLASDKASYITGQTIIVDGGLTL